MLNAAWLQTFTVLCETGSFTQAARRLNMTQPGVSQHLRKLEGQLDRALIARHGKKFSLTPAGEAVLRIGLSRRKQEDLLRDTIAHDRPDKGPVSLACSGSFALLCAHPIYAMMDAAPALDVRLEAAPQASVLAGVLDGKFDLGVVAQDPAHPRLDAHQIGLEEVCLVMPAAASVREVSLQYLEELGFIAHPDGYHYADSLLARNFGDAYQGADRLRRRAHVNQIGQIPAMVANGLGYTVLPRSGIEAFDRLDALHIARLPERRFQELWRVSLGSRPLSARVRRLADLVADAAGSLARA